MKNSEATELEGTNKGRTVETIKVNAKSKASRRREKTSTRKNRPCLFRHKETKETAKKNINCAAGRAS